MSRRSREQARRYQGRGVQNPSAIPQPPRDDDVVVGWFAYHGAGALCDGEACIIAGSHEAIRKRTHRMKSALWQHRSTTFGEIAEGMRRSGAYAFDDAAYEVFYPLAARNGLPVPPPMPVEPPPGCSAEDHLVHIRFL